MVEFLIENYGNTTNLLNENSKDQYITLEEKYFFNIVNDSKNLSLDVIKRFNLQYSAKNSFNQTVKTKNNINLTDYFAIPFLIIQKMLDSMDGSGCVVGRIKLSPLLW